MSTKLAKRHRAVKFYATKYGHPDILTPFYHTMIPGLSQIPVWVIPARRERPPHYGQSERKQMSDAPKIPRGWRRLRIGEIIVWGDKFITATGRYVSTIHVKNEGVETDGSYIRRAARKGRK